MGEKISKAMIDDLIAKGATVGKSMAESEVFNSLQYSVPDSEARMANKAADRKIDSPNAGIAFTFRIPNWCPTPLNKILYGKHWSDGARLKKSDSGVIAHYSRNVPKASQKRSVSLHVVFPKGKRMPDVDAYAKTLLDALKNCGLLVNDSSAWCVMHPVSYSRGESLVTFITIEDV